MNGQHFRSFSVSSTSSTGQRQGKYVERLVAIEQENANLKNKLGKIERWKVAMEAWILDEFGVTLDSESDSSNLPSHSLPRPGCCHNLTSENGLPTPSVIKDEAENGADNFSEVDNSDIIVTLPPLIPTRNPNRDREESMSSCGSDVPSITAPPTPTPPIEIDSLPYSEDSTPCDVCRTIHPEPNNQMIFCEGNGCNICVHQACYGIPEVPAGAWKCRTCAKGIAPGTQECLFCPTKGGAMTPCKSPSMKQWAHVSCTLWIPEITFASKILLEPVIAIPNIPKARWDLVCSLCPSRKGACIQCSSGRCKTAYHVTCAMRDGLRMDIFDVGETVKMDTFCRRHSDAEISPSKRKSLHKAKRSRMETGED